MPRGDGTGPQGKGPVSGGGQGACNPAKGSCGQKGQGSGKGTGQGKGAGRQGGSGASRGQGQGRGGGKKGCNRP